ncbi:TPA: hypothetical protein RQK94_001781 [Vibrio vulnificus]|nr:hypothetical protein [Vibrio vulnificus]HDY8102392.1 hypothetical protein [Vibrio vulnificus]
MFNVAFQVSNIAVMMIQSFLLPFFIGMESFGKGILLLSPVFIAQGIVEPIFQGYFNRNKLTFSIVLVFSLIMFSLIFVTVMGIFIDSKDLALIFLFSIVYICFTAFQSYFMANGKMKIVAFAVGALAISYGLMAVVGCFLELGYLVLLYSNLLSFFIAFLLYFFFVLKLRVNVAWKFDDSVNNLVSSSLMRLPYVFLSSGLIVVSGFFGYSHDAIARLKIFSSIVNSGRYFNLIPLSLLQVEMGKRVDDGYHPFRWSFFYKYTLGVLVFTIVSCFTMPYFFEYFYQDDFLFEICYFFAFFLIMVQPVLYVTYHYLSSCNYATWKLYLLLTFFLASFAILLFFFSLGLITIFSILSGFLFLLSLMLFNYFWNCYETNITRHG